MPELLLVDGVVVQVVELGQEAVEVEDHHLPGPLQEDLNLVEGKTGFDKYVYILKTGF